MNNLMKKKVSVLDLIRGNSVPMMFVCTACIGKNSQEGTCLSAAAWKM